MERREEMELERLSHCGHPHLVPQGVTVDREVALDFDDLFRCRGARHRRRTEADRSLGLVAVEGAFLHLDDACRVGENEFHDADLRHAPVAGFGVQWAAVVCSRRALAVRKKGLAHVTEGDRLVVVERFDRRVHPAAAAGPGAEQELERLDTRVQRWRRSRSRNGHATIVRPLGYPLALTNPTGHSESMRRTAVALLLVLAACGSSEPTGSPTVIATSSTTAEEARAIDGPVMRYPDASSPSGNLDTLLQGVLELEGDCLYLTQGSIGQRFPILWPAETTWDEPNQSVVSPSGAVMKVGAAVEGRGGFFYLSDIHILAGSAASNLAAGCVDNEYEQTAVVENVPTAIGPKGN